MKDKIRSILFIIFFMVLGYWWYYTYTYVETATLIYKNNDIEETYEIAYNLTTLIIKNKEDSTYIYYDKKGKLLIMINDMDWSKVTIIKN